MTLRLHGETALARAEQAAQALFGGEISGLSVGRDRGYLLPTCPPASCPRRQLEGAGLALVDLLVTAGVAKSKGEARRGIAEGGIYLNNRRVADAGPDRRARRCAGRAVHRPAQGAQELHPGEGCWE